MIATVVSTIFTIWYVIGVCHKVTSKYTVCNECKYFQKLKFNLHVHVSIKLLEPFFFFYNNAIWSWNHLNNHTNEIKFNRHWCQYTSTSMSRTIVMNKRVFSLKIWISETWGPWVTSLTWEIVSINKHICAKRWLYHYVDQKIKKNYHLLF